MLSGSRRNPCDPNASFRISHLLGRQSAHSAAREAIISAQTASMPQYRYNVNRRYNELTYLTAHNAYEYFALSHGKYTTAEPEYAAQIQPASIPDQLAQGVRALMLDIECYNGEVCLCHRRCYRSAIPLAPILVSVRKFLDQSDDAVVTIIFESRVMTDEEKALLNEALNTAGLKDRVFDPQATYVADVDNPGDWPTQRNPSSVHRNVSEDGWPSLLWMKLHKKDLVIFSERRDGGDGFPNIWDYAVENHWGIFSLIRPTWCNPRRESQRLDDLERSLLTLNHFPGSYFTGWLGSRLILRLHRWINSPRFIEKHIQAYQRRTQGRLPNFIAVDFFSIGGKTGSPMDTVRALNQRWEANDIVQP